MFVFPVKVDFLSRIMYVCVFIYIILFN